jgi:L-seryl-tRNA(Ser) seleniumtransferase
MMPAGTDPKPDGEDAPQGRDALYRTLPSVNELLLAPPLAEFEASRGRARLVEIIRRVLDGTRREIAQGLHSATSLDRLLSELPARVAKEMRCDARFSLRRVINATGVILHTNLGRAPLSRIALDHLCEIAAGYSNLEFDLARGERGRRDVHAESALLALLGQATEAHFEQTHRAIFVNNCAAATLLALRSLARGKQVLVSRGELVEIGGGFRIPEILEESGAVLCEVGTTNRTRTSDYEKAITDQTALILRVHQSNFAMDGFVKRPRLEELVALGRRAGLGVFADQGTGLVETLEAYGVRDEETIAGSVARGCDLVAASGDKLFGGPQCGILVGRREWIERVRSSPLYRAFRADKLNYAALEATLNEYLYGDTESVPVMRMLRMPEDAIRRRCEGIADAVQHTGLVLAVIAVKSVIGGGTAPKSTLPSHALALTHAKFDAPALLAALRRLDPPIIGRIEDDRVLLDLRTVEPEFDQLLIGVLSQTAQIWLADAGAPR